MPRRWVTVAFVATLALGFAAGPLSAAPLSVTTESEDTQDGTVVGRPNFELVIPDNHVSTGEDATLSAVLVNDARVFRGGTLRDEAQVTTAYNVSIRPRTEQFSGRLADGLSFETQRIPVGTVPSGVTDPIPFQVTVGQLPPGEYRVPFAVTYSYTAFVQPNQTVTLRTRTDTLTATLVVEPDPRLRISSAPDQSLTPGQSDTVRFEVTNTGTETATEVGLTLSADNGSVYFGTRLDRQSNVGVYVPALAPGETETVAVQMGADDATESGTYLVTGRATYRDESGRVHEAEWLATGIAVGSGEIAGVGETETNLSRPPSSPTSRPFRDFGSALSG